MARALWLAALLIASPALLAGVYGLSVGSSNPHPCKYELTRHLNSCSTAAVAEELRRHFLSGEPFRIKAVEMAVLSGSIWIDQEALPPFNDVIAEICAAESRHHTAQLKDFLRGLPYQKNRILAYKRRLTDAGDRDKCDEETARVGRAMALDTGLSNADIQAEIDRYEKAKGGGSMPYPAPGTACALWGFQKAAHAALEARRSAR